MTLGFICHGSPSGQVRMCVLLDCFMLKPVVVPSLLCLYGSIIKILFFIILGNSITIPLIGHLTTMEVMWATIFYSKQHNTVQIPLRYTSDFPILLHCPPSAPSSLSKCNPVGDRWISCSGPWTFFYFMAKPVFRIWTTFPSLNNFCYCITSHNIVISILSVLELCLVSVLFRGVHG